MHGLARPLPRLLFTRLARPLLALLSGACAAETLPAVDEGGRSLWQRVETEHFVVESNNPSASEVTETASDFEILWHAFANVPVLGRQPPKVKPIVVLLDSESEYRYFAGGQTSGLFFPQGLLGPLILLRPHSGPFGDITVKHELAHFICSEFLPDAPMWLHEGLAQVMETATYDGDDGKVLFGDFLRSRVDRAAAGLPSATFMGEWPRDASSETLLAYYARSWLLVHYLIDEHLREFLAFLVRVHEGADWKTAWAGEIPVRFAAIDGELARYHERAKYGLWTTVARVPGTDEIAQSIVPLADVYALRGLLQACGPNPARERSQKIGDAQRDVGAALALDPANSRAETVRAALMEAAP